MQQIPTMDHYLVSLRVFEFDFKTDVQDVLPEFTCVWMNLKKILISLGSEDIASRECK